MTQLPAFRSGPLRERLVRCATVLLASVLLTFPASGGLREDVQAVLRSSELGAALVGVSIRECDTDRELVAIAADHALIPASNMKLITTGAALHGLGPDFRFQTRLLLDGDRLIVVGDGDPGFGDPELLAEMSDPSGTATDTHGMDVESFISLWVDAVGKREIGAIAEVVVDDRVFDREFVHPSWPADQLNRRYCAEISGLAFHLNVLHFYPKPSEAGRPSINSFQPHAPWLTLTNRATSQRGVDDANSVWIARPPDSNHLTFYGNVKHAHREPVPVTVHDMPDFFAQLLADRLADLGVRVGAHRVATSDSPKPPPITSEATVGPVITTRIETAITRCNRDSQNLYAECLLKRLGHELTGQPGSWINGAAAARNIVHERLRRPALVTGLVIADGSGLSRENRVSPRTLTAWLASFHGDRNLAEPFIDSLARGGDEGGSGTLSSRFSTVELHECVVRAKTGYIDSVSCLSGFVISPAGRSIAFSVMTNELSDGRVRNAKSAQERIVAAIAKHLSVAEVTLGGE